MVANILCKRCDFPLQFVLLILTPISVCVTVIGTLWKYGYAFDDGDDGGDSHRLAPWFKTASGWLKKLENSSEAAGYGIGGTPVTQMERPGVGSMDEQTFTVIFFMVFLALIFSIALIAKCLFGGDEDREEEEILTTCSPHVIRAPRNGYESLPWNNSFCLPLTKVSLGTRPMRAICWSSFRMSPAFLSNAVSTAVMSLDVVSKYTNTSLNLGVTFTWKKTRGYTFLIGIVASGLKTLLL